MFETYLDLYVVQKEVLKIHTSCSIVLLHIMKMELYQIGLQIGLPPVQREESTDNMFVYSYIVKWHLCF